MDGTAELAQLSDLLRLGASTARRIADMRRADAVRIFKLADRAEQIAAELDEILDIPPVHPATPPS